MSPKVWPLGKYHGSAYANVQLVLEGDVPRAGVGWVEEFESSFAQQFEVPFAVAFNSGTSAIHAGLMALGVGPGDEVISPALTVVMDAFAGLHLGATPVFADIDPHTWNIDPADVARKIGPKTKAIIAVSWFGVPVDMAPFRQLQRETGVPILDDSAETLFVRASDGILSGTGADVGIYSFEEKKHLTTGGEGGMLVTSSEQIAADARKFGGIGYRHLTASAGRTSLAASHFQRPDYERFSMVGLNYRMTPLTAAVGLGQLENLQELVRMRQASAKVFLDRIANCDWLIPQVAPPGSEHGYYALGLEFRGEEQVGVTWREFYERHASLGGDGFYGNCLPPYREPVFRNTPELQVLARQGEESCPVANNLQPRIMAFKTNYRTMERAEQQADILSNTISSFL